MLHQQAPQRERDAVPRVGRNPALPQGFGDDAEHGAAVEMLAAAFEGVAAQAADLEGGVGHETNAKCGM